MCLARRILGRNVFCAANPDTHQQGWLAGEAHCLLQFNSGLPIPSWCEIKAAGTGPAQGKCGLKHQLRAAGHTHHRTPDVWVLGTNHQGGTHQKVEMQSTGQLRRILMHCSAHH